MTRALSRKRPRLYATLPERPRPRICSGSRSVRDIQGYLDSLASLAHPDGGWGYAPGQSAHLEPTCLGLLALSLDAERFAPLLDGAWKAVARCAVGDGTYRIAQGREEAVWPTALVLFT